jgi:hypothetical protein
MQTFRIVAAAILGLAAIYVVVLNWWAWIGRLTRTRGSSWIPLIGGVLGSGALLVEPTGIGGRFWWVPLVVDAGSLPGLGHAAVSMIRRKVP